MHTFILPSSQLIHDVDSTRLDTKQNSTNILARNITCRGGTGIAFGSLGQYAELVSGASAALQTVTHTDVGTSDRCYSRITSRTSSSRTSR